MKAYAVDSFGGPGSIRDLPEPVPNEDEVLVEVRAAGVNTTDLAVMAGYMAPYVPHTFPLVPGIDAAGVVVAVGPGVTGFAVGDEVFGYSPRQSFGEGTFAERAPLPTAGLVHKPSAFGFAEVSVIGHGALTALACIDAARVEAGDSIVVLGATGGVGSYAVQMLRNAGIHVVGLTLAQYEGYARSMGASDVIDYSAGDPLAVGRTLCPDGAAALIDLAGIPELMKEMTELVRTGGRVVSTVLPPDAESLAARNLEGALISRFVVDGRLPEVADQIVSRRLKLPAIQVFDFVDIADALALQATRHVHGKLTLRMT